MPRDAGQGIGGGGSGIGGHLAGPGCRDVHLAAGVWGGVQRLAGGRFGAKALLSAVWVVVGVGVTVRVGRGFLEVLAAQVGTRTAGLATGWRWAEGSEQWAWVLAVGSWQLGDGGWRLRLSSMFVCS